MGHNEEKVKPPKESNHWKAQATKTQTKTNYWENEHSVVFEELSKFRKSQGKWKRKVEAKEIQYQKVLEEETTLQQANQVLEHQLLR